MLNLDDSCQLLLQYFLLFVVSFFVALRALVMDQDSTVLGIKQTQNIVTELRCPRLFPPNQSTGKTSCNVRKSEIFKRPVLEEITEKPF